MPNISVIMPAYNAEKYIREAIDSILAQTFTDFEFIIIDDGSKDYTTAIVQSYSDSRIRFYQNERNVGVAATLNRGLDLAQGEYIARMDADDISLPERFEKQKAYLDTYNKIAVCGTSVTMFCDKKVLGTRTLSATPQKMKENLFFSCGLAHPSVMMRSLVIHDLGGYDLEFNGMEDYELWCRVSENYNIISLPDILLRYRIHDGQVTKHPTSQYFEQLRRLKNRQVSQLGVLPSPEEMDAYIAYCAGTFNGSYQAVMMLGHFFEKVADGNRLIQYYDQELLLSDFKSVLLKLAMNFDKSIQQRLCSECALLSSSEIRRRKGIGFVKKLLNRS